MWKFLWKMSSGFSNDASITFLNESLTAANLSSRNSDNSYVGVSGTSSVGDISMSANGSLLPFGNLTDTGGKRDFVFDRTDVRVIFITLYSMVFCCCFFGNFFHVNRCVEVRLCLEWGYDLVYAVLVGEIIKLSDTREQIGENSLNKAWHNLFASIYA